MVQVVCQNCGATMEATRNDKKWCDACRVIKNREVLQRYEQRHVAQCLDCGKPVVRRSLYCKSCGDKHAGNTRRGERNGFWAGGTTSAYGYVYVRKDDTGNATGRKAGAGDYRPEHQLVWEATHSQPIPRGWVVHHINGLRGDNSPENLVAMPRGQHQKIYGELRQAGERPGYRHKHKAT